MCLQVKHPGVFLFVGQAYLDISGAHFLDLAAENLFVDGRVLFRVPFIQQHRVTGPEIRQKILRVDRHFQIHARYGPLVVEHRFRFQSRQNVSVALFGHRVPVPDFRESAS